jgi:hypothetical protein
MNFFPLKNSADGLFREHLTMPRRFFIMCPHQFFLPTKSGRGIGKRDVLSPFAPDFCGKMGKLRPFAEIDKKSILHFYF